MILMTIRSKLMLAFSLFTFVAVVAGSGFVLQKAINEKSSYVNELNSLLVPQLRSEIDQRLRSLALPLNQLAEKPIYKQLSKNQLETLATTLRSSAPYVDAIILMNNENDRLVVQINTSQNLSDKINALLKDLQFKNKADIATNKFQITEDAMAIYRVAGGPIVGLVFNRKDFFALTELSRGKDSYIINNNSEILFSNTMNHQDSYVLPSISLGSAGANIIGTDIQLSNGLLKTAFLAKLEMLNNAYVMIVEDKVSWLKIATPLLNSTISLLIVLIITSLGAALWLSKSIAAPIEKLTSLAAKVGVGEWKPILINSSSVEITQLTSAFNAMIENLQRRERDLKLAHQKLIRTESLAAVGRIGAGVAHEVKNPLASVLSYAQLLERQINQYEKDSETLLSSEKVVKIKNYNSMILEDTRRASRIINDLLTFARQKEIQVENINAESYLLSIKEKILPLCQQNNISFEIFSDAKNKAISIDKEQVYQVIYNLVQNASHALESKDSEKKISISLKNENGFVQFIVEDNGEGIAPENLEKIFEPFYSTKNMGQGSGLGLAISYGIMQMHNGQIHVKSTVNIGTAFTLAFPEIN